ncbi:MAG: hypothetical protein J7M25_08520 [Deltaproteobacteria bacterium]|nr:hypothetical protein [Deltaproteobacteria bacterium]
MNSDRISEFQKEVVETMQTIFNTSLEAFNTMHDQVEQLMETVAKKGEETQRAGTKVMQEWLSTIKKNQDEFRNLMNENFQKMETFLGKKNSK